MEISFDIKFLLRHKTFRLKRDFKSKELSYFADDSIEEE